MTGDNTIAIVQARMGSTRLPGKILLPIVQGKGALELMLERVSKAKSLSKIVVATTNSPEDDQLVDLCDRLRFSSFRGEEEDVLDRYFMTASHFGPRSSIVRLTGDCPLHDSEVIDKVVEEFEYSGVDYCSNLDPPTYPDGLDTEVFSFSALEKSWKEAILKSDREHVTLYIRNHKELFSRKNVEHPVNFSSHRWTLDEESDYRFLKKIYQELYISKPGFKMADVLAYLREYPSIAEINRGIGRDEGLMKSLAEDQGII